MGESSKDRIPESKRKVSWRLCWAFSKAQEMELKVLCLEKLAEEAQLSRGYLSRSFPLVADRSFEDYRRDRRIAEGKKLLLETPMTLEQIAFFLGFARSEGFSNMLEDTTGFKPNAYRDYFWQHGKPPPDRGGAKKPNKKQ